MFRSLNIHDNAEFKPALFDWRNASPSCCPFVLWLQIITIRMDYLSSRVADREGGEGRGSVREICQKIRLKSETEGKEREGNKLFFPAAWPISGGSCSTRKSCLAHAVAAAAAQVWVLLPPRVCCPSVIPERFSAYSHGLTVSLNLYQCHSK